MRVAVLNGHGYPSPFRAHYVPHGSVRGWVAGDVRGWDVRDVRAYGAYGVGPSIFSPELTAKIVNFTDTSARNLAAASAALRARAMRADVSESARQGALGAANSADFWIAKLRGEARDEVLSGAKPLERWVQIHDGQAEGLKIQAQYLQEGTLLNQIDSYMAGQRAYLFGGSGQPGLYTDVKNFLEMLAREGKKAVEGGLPWVALGIAGAAVMLFLLRPKVSLGGYGAENEPEALLEGWRLGADLRRRFP